MLGTSTINNSKVEKPYVKAIEARDVPGMVDALMQHPTLVPSARYPEARQRVRQNLAEYSFVWVLDPAPREEMQPPAGDRLAEIQVPTLVIVGEDDNLALHRFADMFEEQIANTRRISISQTGHMPNIEKPAEFNHSVLGFLSAL